MNSGTLIDFFNGRSLSTGSIVGLYNFTTGTGCIVFNDYYNTGKQLITGNINKPKYDFYPAISIGCTNNILINNPVGSGYFAYSDILRIGDTITGSEDWTFFINYRKEALDDGNVAAVLATTMGSYTGQSGFTFGVNSVNHPFLEYVNDQGVKKGVTSNHALGVQNLISVSKVGEDINITNHDVRGPNGIGHLSTSFRASGITDSNVWHLGNFPNTGQVNPSYTGFSGYMDDFLLLQGGLPLPQQNVLAETFFQSGIQTGYKSGYLISGLKTSGVIINPTGITGTGVTGMLDRIYDTVQSCLCNEIVFYKDSGVTGYLTGEVVSFMTGSGYATGIDYIDKPGLIQWDYPYIKQHAEHGLSFISKINPTDRYEVYSYNEFYHISTLINHSGDYNAGFDHYTMDTGYIGGNVNAYLNGTGLYSGVDFNIVEGQGGAIGMHAVEVIPTGIYGSEDTLMYDKISGVGQTGTIYTGFAVTGVAVTVGGEGYTSVPTILFEGGGGAGAVASGVTGAPPDNSVTSITVISGGSGYTSVPTITFSGGVPSILSGSGTAALDSTDITISVTNKDVYVGGLKLISGLDYTQTATQTTITATQLQNGKYTQTGLYDLFFLPRYQTSFNNETGLVSQYVQTSFSLIDEQVWVGGKRLLINKDYYKVSRLGTMKKTDFVPIVNDSFYSLEIDEPNSFFNI